MSDRQPAHEAINEANGRDVTVHSDGTATIQPDTKPVKEAQAPVKNERLSEIEKDIKPFR